MTNFNFLENSNSPFSEQAKETEYLYNFAALEKLKDEYLSLLKSTAFAASIGYAGTLASISPVLILPLLLVGTLSAERLIRIGRLCDVTKLLLEAFGNEGIKITPQVKTDDGIIDLLVKMPNKQTFALTLRSKGGAKVKWREDRQDFFVSRKSKKGRAVNKWSDLLGDSKKSELVLRTLRKQKSPLLGASTNERNKPVVKAVILTGETTLSDNNNELLLVDYGESKVLRVRTDVVVYMLEQKDLINFLTPPK